MDTIKKTITITDKTPSVNTLEWNYYPEYDKVTKFTRLEIISIQLSGIDPTDVSLEYRMLQEGQPLQPTNKIYLGHYGGEFIYREKYFEFFPKGNEIFILLSPPDCNYFTLTAINVNQDIKNPSFTCTLNVLFHP